MEKLYTVAEVAETLNVTRQTVYNWINDGDLKVKRIKGVIRITRKSLEEFVNY